MGVFTKKGHVSNNSIRSTAPSNQLNSRSISLPCVVKKSGTNRHTHCHMIKNAVPSIQNDECVVFYCRVDVRMTISMNGQYFNLQPKCQWSVALRDVWTLCTCENIS